MLFERDRKLVQTLIAFGIVGITAVLAYSFLFIVLIEDAGFSGLSANAIALAASFTVSYIGQSRWTFADRKKRSVLKFSLIAGATFALSSACAWLLVDRLGLASIWVLPIILIVIPSMSFLMMRRWAFTS